MIVYSLFTCCLLNLTGTILIRTNRVSRIFNEKLLRTGTISCLSNYWQLFILGCLLTTELALSIAWVFGPSTNAFKEVIYSESSKDASLVCNLTGSQIGFALWLIYNAGLVIVCTYQAFLVRKVPQNYNESRLIAFNMTTMCITILVYIPSYMGTTAWYRAVISSLMFIFLGTLTWASIFAPKIYIILFRPHKNIPMRPSVSSIKLGVITASPTVVSSCSEQGMPSGPNSLSADESLEGIWATFGPSRDSSDERRESDSKGSESENTAENTKPDNASTDSITRTENFEMPGRKKTSVVRFEDGLTMNNIQINDGQIIPRKKSSNQAGILRKSNTSENFEDLSNGSTRKKKTSLVRFQDEVANHYKFNGPDSINTFNFPSQNEEPDEVSVDGINFGEESVNAATLSRCFPIPKLSGDKRNMPTGCPEQGRKRKISVFAFQ